RAAEVGRDVVHDSVVADPDRLVEGVEDEDAASVVERAGVAVDQVAIDIGVAGAGAQRPAADDELALDRDAAARLYRLVVVDAVVVDRATRAEPDVGDPGPVLDAEVRAHDARR